VYATGQETLHCNANNTTCTPGKQALYKILEDSENSSREENGYVIIDVRNPDEIAYTCKLIWQSVLKLSHCLLLHQQEHSVNIETVWKLSPSPSSLTKS
jgi:hypothetical protein